jgi:hypothetical protein
VRSALEATPGVGAVDYTVGQPRFEVRYDPALVDPDRIAAACAAAGHSVAILERP